jgi:hypothetical protein
VITETLSEAILGADAAFFEALIEGDIPALEGLLGEQFDVASRYTHVFHADGGSWRLISAQGTPITDNGFPRGGRSGEQ